MNNHCPICNKAGLPDYTITHTVCPQCNSDLKPFMLLHSISKPNSNKRTLFVSIGISLVAFVLAVLYFNSFSENKKIVSENSKTVLQLQDSIHNLQSEIAKPNVSASKKTEEEITIQYKVKYGDYPSKIAQFFYNDWKMYKKIEADNNLQQTDILKVGQTLTIKIKQQ